MKGAKSNDAEFGGTLKMNYVEIPVLLRVDVPVSGGTKPYFYGGPAVSFKASCNVEATSQGVTVSASCDELEAQGAKLKSVDYGVVVGAGLGFDVGGRLLTIGARYNHSLADIAENSDTKHRVISILATFEFPWK
jgi:opacity protein-like surface antigen